jgi:hypothetical protein
MAAILFVRVTSDLDFEELQRRMAERQPRFREVPGLIQKFYGRDPSTGAACGVYLFQDGDALSVYRASELARTIPTAYEAKEIRAEAYEVLESLHPDRGPLDRPAPRK